MKIINPHIKKPNYFQNKKLEKNYTKAYHNQIAQKQWKRENIKSSQVEKRNTLCRKKYRHG